jgi:hypothetical protein
MDNSLDKTIQTQTGEQLANSIVYSTDGKSVFLAYGCPYLTLCQAQGAGGLLRVGLESGQVETLIPYGVYAVTFSADQNAFAIEGEQRPQSGQVSNGQYQAQTTYTSPMGNGALEGAAITPDGQLFFSGNGMGLHAWDAASGKMVALVKGSMGGYGEIQVTTDQKVVLIANGLVFLWGVRVGQ